MAIVVGAAATKLPHVSGAVALTGNTYGVDQTVDVCADFWIDGLGLGERVIFLHSVLSMHCWREHWWCCGCDSHTSRGISN
jgi:hypothetical protein